MQASPTALDRNQLGRYLAALFGLLALVCFYQPWVSGTIPAAGDNTFSGMGLARGEASERSDKAAFGSLSAGSGAGTTAGAAPTLAAGASVGGLTLPTRVPTVAAGSTSGFSGGAVATTAPAAPAAPASSGLQGGTNLGGLTLPTRVPTVAPGAASNFGGAPASAATSSLGATSLEISRQVERTEPDRLPQSPLYAVPLAALGISIFSLIWGHLNDARDQRFGKWWTILLSAGGTLGVGYVLYKVATAPASNDLLAPGTVKGAQWGLWGAFAGFLLSAICLAIAWTAGARRRASFA